jgi:hypothetical protein
MAKTPARAKGPRRPEFNHPDKRREPEVRDPREPAPNFDLLSEETKERLREDAKVKVEARERARAMDAFLAAEVERIERATVPDAHEEEREVEIDLAIYADRIIVDGRVFMHGRRYTVKKSLYDSLMDIQAQTWKHYRNTHHDPNEASQRAAQAIAKGGTSYATINAASGQVAKF